MSELVKSLRRYGCADKDCDQFCSTAHKAADEIERLQAIVAKLPHTADLVTVTSAADSSYPSNAYLVYPLCCSAREAAEAEGGEE